MAWEQIALLRLYIDDPDPQGDGAQSFFTDAQLGDTLGQFDDNLHTAAGELWLMKAANVSTWYQASLDGSFLSREQVWEHCMEMARFYTNKGGGDPSSWKSVKVETDESANETASSEF